MPHREGPWASRLYAYGLTSKGAPQREHSTPRRNDPSRQVGQYTTAHLPRRHWPSACIRTPWALMVLFRLCASLPEAYALLLRSEHVARRTRHAGPYDRRNHSIWKFTSSPCFVWLSGHVFGVLAPPLVPKRRKLRMWTCFQGISPTARPQA